MVKKASIGQDSTDREYVRKVLAGLRRGELKEIPGGGIALSGKSERTTFSLSQETIDHLENLSKVSGTKIKDLLDDLVKDIAFKNIRGEKNDWGDIDEISEKLTNITKGIKIRKSYVISSGSLSLLNNLSKILKIERNILMENIIISYVRFREKLIAKRYGKYETAYNELWEIWDDATDRIQQLIIKLNLKKDDPLKEGVGDPMGHFWDMLDRLKTLIENPQQIIEWEEEQKRQIERRGGQEW